MSKYSYLISRKYLTANSSILSSYGVMVFDLDYAFKEEFYGVKAYMTVFRKDSRFGIWIFRCGKFVNLHPRRDMSNYVLLGTSKCYKYAEENEVSFYSDNCPNAKYLTNNATNCWN